MPRSVEEIIAHADELVAEAEQYEPRDEDEITVAELDLRTAVVARATVERQTTEAVAAARREGMSWTAIAKLLGTSRQAAQHRYHDRVA